MDTTVKEDLQCVQSFVPTHVFHETPQVSFFDAEIKGSNGFDVVIHHDNAI